ncbi:MAG: hypothetical protein S4CHLAM7_08850 [Chlamydiae bacterium]|nr:hypothetical protein [Chlamydiota bacterium]
MDQESLKNLLDTDVDTFIKSIENEISSDVKLERMLNYMQMHLSHGEIKPINRFWKMRSFCLECFKDNLTHTKRIVFWENYRQMISELLKLKGESDEKSKFHSLEIKKAIDFIEQDLQKMSLIIEQTSVIEIPKNCPIPDKSKSVFEKSQRELEVVSSYAQKLNALKNELASLEISYKDKQPLFDQIHKISDTVFPRRRELISHVSKRYSDDVNHFITINFEKKELKMPLFELKDHIKSFQALAKVLSLNVNSFSQSREKLSDCWDKIKLFEKAHKKIKEEQKSKFHENENRINEQISELKENKPNLSQKIFSSKVRALYTLIENSELQTTQKKKLCDSLNLIDDSNGEISATSTAEENFIQIQRDILNLQEKGKNWDFFALESECRVVQNLYRTSKLLDIHHNKIIRRLFNLKAMLMEKLLEEVENRVDIEELNQQIDDFRNDIRSDLDLCRKALNTSNQSIEKAMLYNELLTQTKLKLAEFDKKIALAKST